jgi:diguanylate cyclase (GGDEF)-like protein/PAS domain S-box-containing protein
MAMDHVTTRPVGDGDGRGDGSDTEASGRFRRAVITAFVAIGVFFAWLATGFLGERATTAVDDLGTMLVALLAAWACLRRAGRQSGRIRRGWRLLGLSTLSWGLGEAVWSYYELAAGRDVPFPSLADVGFLLTAPLALAAVLAFFSPPAGWTSRLRLVVDGLIVGAAVLYVSWIVVLGPMVHGSSGSLLIQVVGLAYPVTDVIIISAVILVGARSRTEDGLPLGWISAGLVGIAVADSAFAYLALKGDYASGNLVDTGWMAGFLFIALAAMKPATADSRPGGRRGEFTLVSYIPVTFVLALAAVRLLLGLPPETPVMYIGGTLFSLVVVRQVFTLRENHTLTADLETKVEARTEQLHRSEERFRSMIQTVSDVISVVDPDGTIRFVSPSVREVFGYEPGELTGQNLFGFLHPDDTPAVATFLQARGDVNRRLEGRFRHRRGGWRYVEAVGSDMTHEGALGGFVFATRDMTERRELEEQLSHQAFHDPLTGLANRALLTDRIGLALARIRRTGRDLTVLFVDLDDFKSVNDTLGHGPGDALLLEVSRRLQGCVRPGDTVARLGGDEFAVLMEESDEGLAIAVAERLQEALRAPFHLGDAQIPVTASVGIARSGPETVSEAELLRNADVAMYQAKAAGKAGYEVFRAEMHEAVVRRVALLGELRTAVEEQQFELHYQPLVGLADRHIVGFEALVRWNHPTRGLVPPLEFIPLAEETGLIIPLGRWILEEATAQLAAWDGLPRTGPPLTMSVNVSARQLQSDDLVATVTAAIERSGLAPARITLELTESILLDDVNASIARLHELKEVGVHLAIDDFGTGFSSLSYLRRFPVDTLKVDKSFVDDMTTGRGAELTRTLLELGSVLGLKTVAEGIEHSDQATALEANGCDFGQGYMFSRPISADRVEALLRDAPAWRPVPLSAGS